MDTSKLVVGQEVLLFGIGLLSGKVVSVVPSIDVRTNEIRFLRFDKDGTETDFSRGLRLDGVLQGPGPEWEPWEIVATTPEEIAAWKSTTTPEQHAAKVAAFHEEKLKSRAG